MHLTCQFDLTVKICPSYALRINALISHFHAHQIPWRSVLYPWWSCATVHPKFYIYRPYKD